METMGRKPETTRAGAMMRASAEGRGELLHRLRELAERRERARILWAERIARARNLRGVRV